MGVASRDGGAALGTHSRRSGSQKVSTVGLMPEPVGRSGGAAQGRQSVSSGLPVPANIGLPVIGSVISFISSQAIEGESPATLKVAVHASLVYLRSAVN